MSEKYDERDLERIMRAGLVERAERADTVLDRPFSPRRERRKGLWFAAAAAVVVVGVPVAVAQLRDGDSATPSTPQETEAVIVPDGWRPESYDGIQVRVPPTWGWGGAPFEASWADQRTLACGAEAFLAPGSSDYENVKPGTPYVGRPVPMTDVCSVVDPERPPEPTSPYVWLDASVPLGSVEFDNDYVRETIQVGDGTVSVATDDAGLRAQILASAESVALDANGCRTHLGEPPEPKPGSGELGEVDSLSICVYDLDGAGRATLTASDRVGDERATSYLERGQAERVVFDPGACSSDDRSGQWVAIAVNGRVDQTGEPWTRTDVANFDCRWIETPTGFYPLSRDIVETWATEVVRAYVVGPVEADDLTGLFQGSIGG